MERHHLSVEANVGCSVICSATSSWVLLHLGHSGLHYELAQDYNSPAPADGSVLSAWRHRICTRLCQNGGLQIGHDGFRTKWVTVGRYWSAAMSDTENKQCVSISCVTDIVNNIGKQINVSRGRLFLTPRVFPNNASHWGAWLYCGCSRVWHAPALEHSCFPQITWEQVGTSFKGI